MTASSYKPGGPLASLSLANGLTETRAFDNRYRPDRIQAGSLLDWDYTEDAVGNPTQITGTIVGQPYSATFTYQDPQYFLTQGNGPWGPRFWTYDRIGNRLTNQESGEPAQTYTYAGTGHNPKLMQIAPAPGLGAGTLQFGYDAAGNQTSKQQTDGEGDSETQFLDASQENKLSALRAGAGPGRSDMLYDGRGYLRQAHLTFTGSPEFVKVTPTYSSEGLLMTRVEDRAWTGSTPGPDGEDSGWLASNTEATRVFYFAGRPVAQLTTAPDLTGAELLYLTTDHLGTPVVATNPAGQAVWAGGLEPFGRVWTAGGSPDPEPGAARAKEGSHLKALGRLAAESVFLRYPGQWASDAFRLGGVQGDLYYNVNRWYEDQRGRYTQVDPLGFLFSSPNLYSYAVDRPSTFSDSLGLQPFSPVTPDAIFYGSCAAAAFQIGHDAGERIGFRYGHCIAACYLSKCGIPKPVIASLGFANEVAQTAECLVMGENCHTAFGKTDFADNRTGFTCPRKKPCEQHCSRVPPRGKLPHEYGPFYGWPGYVNMPHQLPFF